MRELKMGDSVLVRTVSGEVERRVWEDAGETVYVCSDRQLEALGRGWDAPMPIGFPRADVSKK